MFYILYFFEWLEMMMILSPLRSTSVPVIHSSLLGEDYDQAMTYIGCFLDNTNEGYVAFQLSIDMCLIHCRRRSSTYFFKMVNHGLML